MADIVNSLFGIDPAALQQQRQVLDSNQAFRFAQLDPLQRANMAIYQGSAGIGRGVSQLLGGDEQLNKATKVRELASQFDMASPDGLRQFAQAVSPFAPDVAQQAVRRSDEIITKGLQQGKLLSETFKLDTEARLAGREIKEIGVEGNTELVQKAVVDKDGNIIGRIGQPYSRFTSKQNISVDAKGETEFVKKLAGLDAKRVNDAADARDNAIAGLTNLNQLSSLSEKDLIGGAFATTRVGAVNFLNTLGLTGATDIDKLARSEQYAKTASDLVLQTLGGRLGAGFSNEDRKFIEKIVPQLENSAIARRDLITFMQTKFTNIVNESDRLETYARENNSLKGYKYTTPLPKAPSTKPQFTREQLEAALKRKLEEGKK
jgi:hypothetical protein